MKSLTTLLYEIGKVEKVEKSRKTKSEVAQYPVYIKDGAGLLYSKISNYTKNQKKVTKEEEKKRHTKKGLFPECIQSLYISKNL